MPIDEIIVSEASRAAHLLIKQHGPDAIVFAAMNADKKLDEGDVESCRVWQRIVAAIKVLECASREAHAVHQGT